MGYSKFIYRLGGTTHEVIKRSNPDIRTKYSNLGYSLLLSSLLAAMVVLI